MLIVISTIIGSSIAFFWYNCYPAEIFMGDLGSLSLGAVIGVMSVISKQELLLVVLGGVFVAEALSVILQVGYFKYTSGKRIFLMSPIHHHFEKLGIKETKVVARFWIASVIFASIGLVIYFY